MSAALPSDEAPSAFAPLRLTAPDFTRPARAARPASTFRRPAPGGELALPMHAPCRVEAASGGLGYSGLLLQPLTDGPVVVCAPCAGVVIESVDAHAASGNHLLLRRDGGGYVRLAPLRHGSIRVHAGERVALGAALAEGDGGKLLLHYQDCPDPFATGRSFRLAGTAQLGNGGPRWVAITAAAPGQHLHAGVIDADLEAALALLSPSVARFAVAARGARAERFCASCSTVATLSAGDDPEGGRRLRDEAGGTLIASADAHAWRTSLAGRAGALLRCLALGLPVAPLTRLPGMWWCETVAVPAIGNGLAARLARRRTARCLGSYDDQDGDIVVRSNLRTSDPGLPESIEIRLAAEHGIVAVRATFADGWLCFTRPGFVEMAA